MKNSFGCQPLWRTATVFTLQRMIFHLKKFSAVAGSENEHTQKTSALNFEAVAAFTDGVTSTQSPD